MNKLIACVFIWASAALASGAAHAHEYTVPPDAELLAGQDEANVAHLRQIAKQSAPVTAALLSGFAVTKPDQFIIARLPYGSVALARWGERHAFISMSSTRAAFPYQEVPADQWRAAFKAIAEHAQQAAAEPKRDKSIWTPGFDGIVHMRDQGKARDYLLSTDDVYEYHYRNPVDAFLCRHVGNHCSTSDWTTPGWIMQIKDQMFAAPNSPAFEQALTLCQKVHLGDYDAAAQLLDQGADIDAWQRSGCTCYAGTQGPNSAEQRAWLVAHHASVTRPNLLGLAP